MGRNPDISDLGEVTDGAESHGKTFGEAPSCLINQWVQKLDHPELKLMSIFFNNYNGRISMNIRIFDCI